ncbi:flavin reductase family protein [Amycolatopsis sp. NPDC051128]|uniref:flavin reductase family protein n=1 Tax=Amycolatopsis sp. NPDC051128 TaxID=3155412 RepID=UPI0034359827
MTGENGPPDFDALVGVLDYPMYIVTCADGTRAAGCLVGFAAQCSISPPRFMVWLSDKNHTREVARGAEVLAVHRLTTAQKDLARLFGGTTGFDADKFARCRWHRGPRGVPVLDDCPRWFAGEILGREVTGDHVAHLLRPIAAAAGGEAGRQLGFQDVRDLEPGNEA